MSIVANVRRVAVVALMMAALLLAAVDAGTTTAVAAPAPAMPTDQVIIRFHDQPGVSRAARQIDRLSEAAGRPLAFVRPVGFGDTYVYRLPSAMAPDAVGAVARDLMALPEVAYAEPDVILRHTGIIPGRSAHTAPPRSAAAVPDDPGFALQWHYQYEPGVKEGANLPAAWDITTGSPDVVVAVLDTGIRPHAEFTGRVLPGYDFISSPFNANDDDPPGNQGSNRDADPSDPGDWNGATQCDLFARDSSWHGTHVAGTIAAASNNGADVAGVNWQARILPVRVLGRCGGFLSDVAPAIAWAAGLSVDDVPPNPNPAHVINMSLGASGACGPSSLMQLAIHAAVAAGTVVVASAGNEMSNADFSTPAGCDGVITVAAGDRLGDLATYSNYGPSVELTAPGGEGFPLPTAGVLSTSNAGKKGPADDALTYMHGTSMAAPHVAGVAALLMGLDPTLTPAQVTDLLVSTTRDFPDEAYCNTALCGSGLLDAYRAVSAITGGQPPHLLAPDDGATLNTPRPLFEWATVIGATGYGLMVSTDEAFGDVVLDVTTSGTSFDPDTGLPDDTYYWRVNTRAGDEVSGWSETRSFTLDTSAGECETPPRPVLLSPGDGMTYDVPEVTFAWESAGEPSFYELRVSQSPTFNTIYIGEQVNATSYIDPAPLDAGTYYWSVRGRNHAEGCAAPGEWSQVWSFTVDIVAVCPVPEAPQLLSPPDGLTTTELQQTLSWSPVANATHYVVYIDSDSDLSSPGLETMTVETTVTTPQLPPGDYYWGVRAGIDLPGECEQTGPLSEIRLFTIEPEPVYTLFLPGVVR